MTTRLEGSGAGRRLKTIQRDFRRAGPERQGWPVGLFIAVFILVFLGTLLALERPEILTRIGEDLSGQTVHAGPTQPAYRYFSGCDAARAAGAAPIYRWQPGYREEMDGDNDGVACEPYR